MTYVYVLSHMSDVEILYKALEFTFSMTYKTTAKYQPIVVPESIYSIFLKCRSLNVNSSVVDLTELCIHISRFTVVRPS